MPCLTLHAHTNSLQARPDKHLKLKSYVDWHMLVVRGAILNVLYAVSGNTTIESNEINH